MPNNQFMTPEAAPDTAAVAAALGDKLPWYEALLAASAGFERQWKYYGRKYGWKLKVTDGTKTLLELTVDGGHFRVGMAVREAELRALRADPEAAAGLGELLDADKAAEGWGLRLVVDDERRFQQALLLVRTVAALRASPSAARSG